MSHLTLALTLLILSLLLSHFLIDKVRSVVLYKQIMDDPNERSSHNKATPNLGGIAFYVVIVLAMYFIAPHDKSQTLLSYIAGLTILFIAGLKDDLTVLSARAKLMAQLAAAFFLIFHNTFSLEVFEGFLGINQMNQYLAIFIAVFIVIAVINAVNLIDGIDGLASIISLVVFLTFGSIFYYIGEYALFLINVTMVGVLLPFLRYNLSTKKKIFMGDTGSMILGFLISVMVLNFLSISEAKLAELPFEKGNIPYVIGAILIVPFFDTARVFTIRLLKKKSPFSPDRNHIHHVIIDKYEISHGKASLALGIGQVLIVFIIAGLAMFISQWYMLLFFFILITALVAYFFYINKPKFLRAMRYQRRIKIWRKQNASS